MEQARRLIAENLRTQNPYLDLGNCGLTDLRELPELFECTHLEELVLSNEWYNFEENKWIKSINEGKENNILYLSSMLYRFEKMKKFICTGTYRIKWELKEVSFIQNLKQLTYLDLSFNQISNITNFRNLDNLTNLYLSINEISDISSLQHLTQLTKLSLKSNQISNISNLKALTQLTKLDLQFNQISDISSLKALTQLTYLDLSGNQLSDISILKELTQLTDLYLSFNQLNDISSLKSLTQLTKLILQFNQISDISSLKALTQLTNLYLSNNQISDISSLKDLMQLTNLDLSDNQLSDISSLKDLTQLTDLYLSGNQVSDISSLKRLINLKYLSLWGNPFAEKAGLNLEESSNNLETIQNYFSRQEESEQYDVTLPAKILLLGNHGVGKSTLLHFLQHENLDIESKSTHIINIATYSKKDKGLPDAIFYDFGGQDYYHGIYRAFLSIGSIYCLLWNPDTNKNYNRIDSNKITTRDMSLAYWLGQKDYIENKKNSVEKDALLLIQTYADNHARTSLGNNSGINNEFYISLNKTSNTQLNLAALQYLKATLLDLIEQKQIKREEPQWYIDFLDYILDTKAKGHESLDIQNIYDNHYKRNKDDNELTFSFFKDDLEQLHRQGLILYYKDELPDVVWLNPKALVQFVHDKILNKKIIIEKKGVIPVKTLKNFDCNIIELLKLQKVLFLHEYGENGQEYIIPNYLPLTKDAGIDYDLFTFGLENPAFTLHFEQFIPMGIVNQMICHFGRLPDKKKFWRDQLLFTFEQKAKVLINVDMINLDIKVYTSFVKNVPDYEKEKIHKYLFYCILSMYSDVFVLDYESYFNFLGNNLEANEINNNKFKEPTLLYEHINFYVIDNLYISLNNQHFIKYKRLHEIENERVIQSYIKEGEKFVLHKDIPIYDFKIFTNKKLSKMKKVFISYSHDDLAYRKELQKFLINLERENQIEIWQDGLINPGDEWDKTIQESLENADIVILLVSQSFIASTYSNYVEMRKAMQNHRDGSAKIIPILIKTCDWQKWKVIPENLDLSDENLKAKKYEMGNYQFMPMNDEEQRIRPVNKWDYQEDAWQKVVDYIRNKCL